MIEGELLVELQVHVQEVIPSNEPVMLPPVANVVDRHGSRRILNQF